jgi:LysR family transcriptional regulator, glycine cleavage system transcriptional activator
VQGAPDHWGVIAASVGFKARNHQRFDSYLSTLQAAAHGVGIALGLFPISSAWVHDGRLVAPLKLRAPAAAYQLVLRPGDEKRADVAALRHWLAHCFAGLPALDAR